MSMQLNIHGMRPCFASDCQYWVTWWTYGTMV